MVSSETGTVNAAMLREIGMLAKQRHEVRTISPDYQTQSREVAGILMVEAIVNIYDTIYNFSLLTVRKSYLQCRKPSPMTTSNTQQKLSPAM